MNEKVNYNEYQRNRWETVKDIFIFIVAISLLSYFFYRSWFALLAFLPSLPFYLKYMKQRHIEATKKELSKEFSQMLQSVSVNMKAGYAIENAFLEAKEDIDNFFGGESLMSREINLIRRGLAYRKPLEEILTDFAIRSGVEDIVMFAQVFATAKRSGGNIEELLERTAETLKQKELLERELELVISEKKMELYIMEGIPFFILVYVDITQKGYFDVLYGNIAGVLFMTACLVVYLAAVLLGSRIMKIET